MMQLRIGVVLGEFHDSKRNVRMGVHCEVEEFTNQFAILCLKIVNIRVHICVTAEREGWIHWERNRIALAKVMLFKEIYYIILLMHPELSCSMGTNILNTQMLGDWT
jgi:hypothetical protein